MPSDHSAVAGLDAPDAARAWLDAFLAVTGGSAGTHPGGPLDGLFAEVFLNGDPSGSAPVPRAALLQALPQREKLFTAAGLGDPRLEAVTYASLGDHFGVLLTSWRVSALDGGGRTVQLRSSFVLRLEDERAEAVAYLNDQDLRSFLDPGLGRTP
jgi:hypothetical protein